MIQPILLIDQVYVGCELPPDAENIRILKFSQPETLSYDYSIVKEGHSTTGLIAMIDLPAGTWEIICTSKEVYFEGEKAKDKSVERRVSFEWTYAELCDLLISKGLDPNKNYIILKKTE